MILEPVLIRPPRCQRPATRNVMTVLRLGDDVSAKVSAGLAQPTIRQPVAS